ncbi:chromate transporter [Deinococcus fonticola]|uniref:chromate transporter n=1 Tax=Deinococcus fonticola TaxID=2528713 RepID=UPI00107506C4|nr:chromate transporter [Deinococcus fonticola]
MTDTALARIQGGISPGALFQVFMGVALVGIGGGLPAHARRALVARGWMTDEEFAEVFTLAQLTPGPNAVNLAAMVGVRLSGKTGAVLAVAGILLPGLLTMLAASWVTLGLRDGLPDWLQSALHGAACAAIGVLLTAAIPVVKVGLGIRGGWLIALLTWLALGVLRLDLLPVLLILLGVGLLIHHPRKPEGKPL